MTCSFIFKQFKLRNIKIAVIRNIKMATLSKLTTDLFPEFLTLIVPDANISLYTCSSYFIIDVISLIHVFSSYNAIMNQLL